MSARPSSRKPGGAAVPGGRLSVSPRGARNHRERDPAGGGRRQTDSRFPAIVARAIKHPPRKASAPAPRPRASLFALAALGVVLFAVPAAGSELVRPTELAIDSPWQRAPTPIDWNKLTDEAADFLSKYIRINTTNPPGREIEAARMLREKFLAEGIPATVWEPQPGRGIVAARLRGVGRKRKTLILLSHMDVVPAEPRQWQAPPFAGEIKNGYVWGRGAVDDKGPGVIAMMAMLAVKRSGLLLHRDVLFVATGDAEQGGKLGAGWFTDHARDIFADAGYLLNEGAGILRFPDQKQLYEVAITEKTPLWLRLAATGPAARASEPPAETAVTHLVRALARLIDYRPPIRVTRPVAREFRLRAQLGNGPRDWLDLASSLRDPLFAREFAAVPERNAKVRDTIAPTVLSASAKTSMIASAAYAEVDCRLLPGEDPKRFLAAVRKALDDKSIKTEVLLEPQPTFSPANSPLMKAIEALARRAGKAKTVSVMATGFSDSSYFRRRNIVSYGFVPLELTPAELRGVHGVDERMGIKRMGEAIRRMAELLEIFGGTAR